MILALFEVFFVIYFAEAQQYQSCANGGIGPCVDGTCPSPTTQTCITIGPGQQVCCENSQIVNPTTTSTCRDLVNPRTGISDCPNVAYLCNNAAYYALMTQQCPRTCNRCPGTATVAPTTTAACQDLVNPRTGTSDCARLAYLCNNSNYYALMTQQCPRTCNRCPGQNTVVAPTPVVAPATVVTRTGTNIYTTGCQDLVDPRTGLSNCAQVAGYCRDARYLNLMRQQCPRTCGYC